MIVTELILLSLLTVIMMMSCGKATNGNFKKARIGAVAPAIQVNMSNNVGNKAQFAPVQNFVIGKNTYLTFI